MSLLGKLLFAVRKVVLVLAVVGLLGGAGWAVWHWHGASDHGFHFRTEKVARGRVAALINSSGTVVPEEVIDIGAQVAGQIIKFGPDLDNSNRLIDYGSRVEGPSAKNGFKGTLLAKIDDRLYAPDVKIAEADLAVAKAEVDRSQADVDAAVAKLDQASRDVERARRLLPTNSIAPQEYDSFQQIFRTAKASLPAMQATLQKAHRNVERAVKVLDKARTNLEYTEIRSPVDGVIVDRRVNIGQTVVSSLNAPSLFLIAKDLKRMQVWVSVNEADVGMIRVGQAANFKVDAYPDEVFGGIVTQIRLNASMTQNVVTYTVVVDTPNVDPNNKDKPGKLLPYLTANLQFRVGERNDALHVPNAALRYRPAADRVAPEYRDAYLATRQRRAVVAELKAGKAAKQNRGTVWVENGDFLEPVKVRLGLTDGNVTEILEVLDGDLPEGAEVVTGELQVQSQTGSNPFAIKMFSGKKKD
jgi:HlyD family secretion protein